MADGDGLEVDRFDGDFVQIQFGASLQMRDRRAQDRFSLDDRHLRVGSRLPLRAVSRCMAIRGASPIQAAEIVRDGSRGSHVRHGARSTRSTGSRSDAMLRAVE